MPRTWSDAACDTGSHNPSSGNTCHQVPWARMKQTSYRHDALRRLNNTYSAPVFFPRLVAHVKNVVRSFVSSLSDATLYGAQRLSFLSRPLAAELNLTHWFGGALLQVSSCQGLELCRFAGFTFGVSISACLATKRQLKQIL